MTHHTDAERAAFEAAIRATMHDAGEDHIAERLERWPDGAYKDRATGYAWWGYQKAARRDPAVPVPDVTDAMIEAANEAYCPFGDMNLAIQAALAAAPQPPEAVREVCATCDGDGFIYDGKGIKFCPEGCQDHNEAAPVQLPEPVAAESRFTTFAGDRWRWCTVEHARAFGADKGYEVRYLYTEQQVRELLAAHGIKEQST